jgi:hypothetical protein
MKTQKTDESYLTNAYHILFPSLISFVTEMTISFAVVAIFLVQRWQPLVNIKDNSDVFRTITDIASRIAARISESKYGVAAITILAWALVGVLVYVLFIRFVLYGIAIWRSYYEKSHDVFPGWYSGKLLRHDTTVVVLKWLLRHVAAFVLLFFGMLAVFPTALNYVHIAIYGGHDLPSILTALLCLVFAGRLVGVGLCILSKKISAWYV